MFNALKIDRDNLREEVERLQALVVVAEKNAPYCLEQVERLAAATELLHLLPEPGAYISRELRDDVEAFLDNQPAAPTRRYALNFCSMCGSRLDCEECAQDPACRPAEPEDK